ncbi:MBL fold metallo-hydrolase [Bacteriovorax sp. DB6_IX]|uniref:MBL fold metallo-hydrolase n=1 Tax=Bacteriovorax sp. DB6_IX TaxID=1353530 RepID=UPI00038A3FD3|nr:MBL fold metallo-hydrolase [Bacteriovorax sp. DB6_IX]EQC49777.1 metallo-beta-lactamase domain protein [Bacteriovorax sp. DB6_IX]
MNDFTAQSSNNQKNSDIKHLVISPGMFRLDGGAMFGIIPKPLWNKVAPADEMNRIDLDLRLWLIQTPTKNILVDTGIGDYHGQKFESRFDVRQDNAPLEKALNKVGLKCEDITDLIISHLHFDHVGGMAVKNGESFEMALKNATIHLHRDHYKYSLKPTQRDAGSFHIKIFEPIIKEWDAKNKINWLENEQGDILTLDNQEVISFKCSHGHTPHMIHPYSKEFIYLADIIPTSNHIHIPWVMGYDISPGISVENKEDFLNFVFENDLKIIYEHDPKYWGSTIIKNDRGHFVAGELFEKSSDHINQLS